VLRSLFADFQVNHPQEGRGGKLAESAQGNKSKNDLLG
jgi:hypothetical protein